MRELPQQKIWKKLEAVPNDIRNAFFSSQSSNEIHLIAEKWGVLPKVSDLAEVVGAIMIGLLPIQQTRQIVQDMLEIDEEKARAIATEIRDKIFSKVAASLRKVHGLDKT